MTIKRRLKAIRRYSDAKILNSFFTPSEIKNELINMMTYRNHNGFKLFILILGRIISFFMEIGALCLRYLTRVKFGAGSVGFIIYGSCLLWLTSLSIEVSSEAWKNFLVAIYQIIRGIFSKYETPWNEIASNWKIGSIPMLVHTLLFFISGLVQLIGMNLTKNWRNKENPEQKGTSIFYFIFKERFNLELDERYYNVFFESAMWTLITIIFFYIHPQSIYPYFLLWCTISLLYQELRDYWVQKQYENI